MRVLVFTTMFPTEVDPVSGVFIHNEVEQLRSAGLDVHVVVPTLFVPPFSKKYSHLTSALKNKVNTQKRIYFSAPNWKFPTIAGFTLGRLLKKSIQIIKPDIVHIHTAFPCSLALLFSGKVGCPLVVTSHGSDWYKAIPHTSTFKKLKSALAFADSILAVGGKLRTSIQTELPEISNRISTQHHGIDLGMFPLTEDRNFFKQKLVLDTNKPLILTIANRSPEKGIDFLLESIACNEQLRSIPCVIIGKRGNEAYEVKLRRIIQEHALNAVQVWDAIPHETLPDWYRAADVYVQPSRSEGFGIAIIEAAATGCPVVATQCGGPEETVTKNVGNLVPFGDKKQLAESIVSMVENKTWDRQKERAEIELRFDKKKKTESLVNHYKELIHAYHTAQKK